MARVFISYASSDLAIVDGIRDWLVGNGHEVFFDRDRRNGIRLGEDWQNRLHERLRWADAVVCLISGASVRSMWCTCEISTAISRGSFLIPVLTEAGAQHPLLSQLQHVCLDSGRESASARILDELRLVDASGGSGWPDNRSPFPGLRPLSSDQRRVFFGRSSEVNELIEMLRSPARRVEAELLLVVGPSGCGKS